MNMRKTLRILNRYGFTAALALLFACGADKAVDLNNQAVDYMSEGKIAQAIRLLKDASVLSPDSAEIQYNLSEAYARQREYDDALTAMEKAAGKESGREDWKIDMGRAQINAGRFQEAIETLEKIKPKEDRKAEYYYLQGRAQMGLAQKEKAVEAIKTCLEADADHFWGNLAMAILLMSDNKRPEAQPYLEKAFALRPDSVDLAKHRADYFAAEDQYDEAIKILEEAMAIDNTDGSLYLQKAQILIKMNNLDEAIKVLESAVARDPESFDAHRTLAWVYNQKDMLSEAKKECDIVLNKFPEDYTCLNIRGAVYAKQKRIPLALADFNRSLQIQQGQTDVEKILEILKSR